VFWKQRVNRFAENPNMLEPVWQAEANSGMFSMLG